MNILSGNKDTDLLILSKLNDRDLLNVCLIENRYIQKVCSYDSFWRTRFVEKFGTEHINKPVNRSWRNHYLKVITDLEFYVDPWEVFDFISWNVRNGISAIYKWQYGGLWPRIITIEEEADETWRNNYYLFNLGDNINIKLPNDDMINIKRDKITPYIVLKEIAKYYQKHPLRRHKFFNGFEKFKTYYLLELTD